jgi:transcriptional regulator with XRE-family HTH domain
MVNTDDFIKRLEILLDYYSLSASVFADKIGVQRSSLSHLLSGRNKPSLDFILKIIEVFPDVDLYWILNGKGTFPKSEAKIGTTNEIPTPLNTIGITENKNEEVPNLFSEKIVAPKNAIEENFIRNISNTQISPSQKNESEIDRIVVFYKNGTFKNYVPQ